MGRTKRKRQRRKSPIPSLESAPSTINLKKWLAKNGWRNESQLRLKSFELTGRGVTSLGNIKVNDVLISIPYDLMITYTTIEQANLHKKLSPSCKDKLTIHDLLALFLAIAKHENNPHWQEYIDSLPSEPPLLPWLCPPDDLILLPGEELRRLALKARRNFEESRERLRQSIRWSCLKCKSPAVDCVLEGNLFTWAYVLVNTRAVYVDPQRVRRLSDAARILSDSPCMALCPYLDMFNHHYTAQTVAEFTFQTEHRLCYQLRSLTQYQKNQQIFISYGAHSNDKLLVEYGFFIPNNQCDVVLFSFAEICDILRVEFNERQFKFIKAHCFTDLFIGYNGFSFNLRSIIFISFNVDVQSLSSIIYNCASYSENDVLQFNRCFDELLKFKLSVFNAELIALENIARSDFVTLLINFLVNKISFVEGLKMNKRVI